MGNHNKYMRERLKWLDEHNFCHKCGKKKCAPNRKHCFDCLEVIRANNRKRYDSQKAKEYQSRRRELYEQHKKEGICVRCKKAATHGMYCYECSIKEKHRSQERAQQKKRERHERGLIPEYRKLNGLCCFCGEPLGERQSYTQCCKTCAEKFSEISYRGDKTPLKQWINAFWLTRWDGLKKPEKENKK